MSLSLSKSLRTNKVSPGANEVAQGIRLFVANIGENLAGQTQNVDQYGRPAPIDGALTFEGPGAPGFFSPEYRIEVENVQRPQYSEYLNVPMGLMSTNSEYQNHPRYDTLGVNRSRAMGLDGTYQTMAYPVGKLNPGKDQDYLYAQEWEAQQLMRLYDQRLWLSSPSTQSGF